MNGTPTIPLDLVAVNGLDRSAEDHPDLFGFTDAERAAEESLLQEAKLIQRALLDTKNGCVRMLRKLGKDPVAARQSNELSATESVLREALETVARVRQCDGVRP